MAFTLADYKADYGVQYPDARIQRALDAAGAEVDRVYGPAPGAQGLRAEWRRWRQGILTLPHEIGSVTSLTLGDIALDADRYTVQPRSIVLLPPEFKRWFDYLTATEILVAGNVNIVMGIIVTADYVPAPQTWRDQMLADLTQLYLARNAYSSTSQAGVSRSRVNYERERKAILYREYWPSVDARYPYSITPLPIAGE